MECLYSTLKFLKLRNMLLALLFMSIVIGYDTNNDQDDEDEDETYIHGRTVEPKNNRVRCGKVKIDLTEFANLYKRDTEEVSSEETFDTATDEDKLIGGNFVIYGEAPWISTIYINKNLSCTTVIVNEFWILATGSCFLGYRVKDFQVKVADMHRTIVEGDERTFDVENVILYPGYPVINNEYNIALVKIKPRGDGSGIQFNEFVQPICLPETGENVRLHDHVTVYSWGYKSMKPRKLENIVKKADLEVLDESDCQRAFPSVAMGHTICVGKSLWMPTFCEADASAPAFRKKENYYIVYGLLSHTNVCGASAAPLVMTSVPSHREWIDRTIQTYSTGHQGDIPRRPSRRRRIKPQ